MHALAAVGWSTLCCLLFYGSKWVLFRGGAPDTLALAATESLSLVAISQSALLVHARERALSTSLGMRPTHPLMLLAGVGLGLSLSVPCDSITRALVDMFPLTEVERLESLTRFRAEGPSRMALLVFAFAIVVPLLEEAFFRGVLFAPLLRRYGTAVAALTTSALSVTLHASWHLAPALLVFSLALGYLRAVSGSLLPPLAAHVVFNAYTATMLSRTQDAVHSSIALGAGWAISAALAWGAYQAGFSEMAARARLEDEQ